ncbi:hypothetical protein M0R72_13860 [Candidatus Pacearchaeota archaeon]|jgi:hypothetical protein|nr:hypothetical protein [Candidatus Pacearchaeota archaeon]
MSNGYIKLYRSLQNHSVICPKRTFSPFEAWVDLLYEAAWEDHDFMYCKTKKVTILRGEVPHSERTLAKRWQWSLSTVCRFLALLKSETMVKRIEKQGLNLLSIVNYDLYQGDDSKPETPNYEKVKRSRNARETLVKQTEEGKEGKEGKETNNTPSECPIGGGHVAASELVMRWNTLATELGLRCVQQISEKRRKAITARKKDGMLEKLEEIFSHIRGSKFLRGANDRGWTADFDFVFCSSENWVKILEGKYDDRTDENHGRGLAETASGTAAAGGKFAGRD